MSDITLACGRLSEFSAFNKYLTDLAQRGFEPIKLSKVEMGPSGFDICILLKK
jgi:hypothetical protein